MKDDELEKRFEKYFSGVTPPEGVTQKAKNQAKRRLSFNPSIFKFASVAASFALIVALSVAIAVNNFNAPAKNDGMGSSTTAPEADGDAMPSPVYTAEELETEYTSAYSIGSLSPSLKFIQRLAVSPNASVTDCRASYKQGKLALVEADADIFNGLNRDQTKIYVEFTPENEVYAPLKEYTLVAPQSYRGVTYYITQSIGENGEPEFKLNIIYGDVKYYFFVRSADLNAPDKYFSLVLN